MSEKKVYLGDSVYAAFDGFHIVLTTDNGHRPSNKIALEDTVIKALLSYIERIYNVKITTANKAEVDHDADSV